MTTTPRVVYFNIGNTLDFEKGLLEEWGVSGLLDLVEVEHAETSLDGFLRAVDDPEGLVVDYFEVTDDVLTRLPHLRVIALQSIGFSNIDIGAATRHSVAVTNAPGFCSEEVALHTVGMIIDLNRKISFLDRSVRAGLWDPFLGSMPHRLRGQTVGLVFFGSIPQLMVPMLHALGMRIVAWAPTKSAEFLAGFGVEKMDTLEALLQASDFVSLHSPLMESTYHLIGEHELNEMKPSAFLINTARGPVVDEAALVSALQDKKIAGAAVDVIENELEEKSDLFGLPNVVITPHSAFLSDESFFDAREVALRQLVSVLVHDEIPSNLVNKDLLTPEG